MCRLFNGRWSDGRQHLVGDGIADRDRLAGGVGFLFCHRTGLCAGNERVTFIAGDADDIGAAFKVHFQFAFQSDGSGIARPTESDSRRYNLRQRRQAAGVYRTSAQAARATRAAQTDPTLNDRLDDLVFAG